MRTVMVDHRLVYSTIVELNSEATVIHTRIMLPTRPPVISGTVSLAKVRKGDTPRLIEASSRLGSIWCTMAEAERTQAAGHAPVVPEPLDAEADLVESVA